MLKYRIVTAIALLLIIVAMMWLLNPPIFAAAVAIFFIIGAAEWTVLIPLKSLCWRLGYTVLVILALYGAYFLSPLPLLCAALLVWLWAAAAICSYQCGASLLGFQWSWIKALTGLVMLVACWKGISLLKAVSPIWLLVVFGLIWLGDTGAFFSGRRWGSHALASRVSPKKTWEGFWGGLCLAVVVISFSSLFLTMSAAQRGLFLVLVIICALFAVVGDLFISVLKRQVGLKDSGSLLPGHGGLLDRVDSTLSAVPIFALGFLLLKL